MVFVEKVSKFCVDFRDKTAIITPALERAPDLKNGLKMLKELEKSS